MLMANLSIPTLCLVWLLAASAVSAFGDNRGHQVSGCPNDELSTFPTKYAEDLQKRVLDIINFARPDDRDWLIKQANFKRRLLMWGFQRMDRNKNGLVDFNEAVRGRWSLGGLRVCQLAFLQECDKDKSRSVSINEWLNCFIPECNKSCVRGQLDKIRCECQCPKSVIQGRIVTSFGAPLHDVSILLGFSTNTEVARTNGSGHFSMIDSCENSSYTVRKNDYIPLRLEGGIQKDGHPLLIHLEDAEPASITVNPKSKTRIVGQSANFTCHAEGTPPITIHWYHNGKRLQEVTTGMRSSLYIENVNGGQGLYKCKATNDYGSEISTPAELKIKEEVLDTCNRIPSSHIIKLPPGCKVSSTGEGTLDIGQCSDEPCSRSSSSADSCGAKDDCCCGQMDEEKEKIVINCGNSYNDLVFYRVTECGCRTCAKRETVIKGEVVGGPNQDPVKKVKVIFRKNVVDSTDKEGKFSFSIPDDVDRVAVTFQDPTDQFFETTQTMPFQRGHTVVHRIVLQEEDPPVTFDSSQDLRVPLGHAEDSMAELELPADNLLHKDGEPFKGKAKLRVSLTDPRNVSDLLSAPGDFTTVDQSGDVQPLKTYGILRIKVQGEDNEQLDVAGNMKIYLDADRIMLPNNSTGEMAPWLWWLDKKTGRWRQMTEMRPVNNSRTKRSLGGRRFYIGDIQTDKLSNINIDIPWKRCYVRAQAYTMTNKGMQPVAGAAMTLIGKENTDTDQEQYYGYTKGVTNKHGIACIPAWCDSNVVLQSNKLSYNVDGSKRVSHLIPDGKLLKYLSPGLEASVIEGNESRSFQFTTKVISQAGPIFGGDEMNKCLDHSDNLVAFKFYLNETTIKLTQVDEFGSWPPGHPLSWYITDTSKPNQEPKKCFIKIKTEYDPFYTPVPPMVSVQSFPPDHKTRYGFSLKEQTVTGDLDWYKVASACVEYRCSETEKETFLVITVLTGSEGCMYLEPVPRLISEFLPQKYGNVSRAMSSRSTSFYAPVDISDGKLGLYSGPGKLGEERCKAGTVDILGEGIGRINSDGYGVLVVDPPECPEEWFELPDESGPN